MSDAHLLKAARGLARLAAEHAPSALSLRLWNGEMLPLGPEADGSVAIALNSPLAIARLLRRPRIRTVVELVASGDLDVVGGTLLDIADRRGTARTKGLWKRLPKARLLSLALPFLTLRGDAARSHAYRGAKGQHAGKGRDDAALVRFHYDLSNAFYGLFLDPRMQYSCAYFPSWEASLEEAQEAKLEMICRKLRLAPGERLLDIGCGWGGLVCHAAAKHGVRAHGVTLSEKQFEGARARIAAMGLEDRVTVELKDWRALLPDRAEGFDKISSIGMFEHVGLANAPAYFAGVRALLRPRGVYLHHAITRPAKRSERLFRRKNPEYQAIVDYVFPGGELDHIGNTVASLERAGFEVHDVEGWREHYARTTRLWTERLAARREEAVAEVGEARVRLWLLYLAGVSLAFTRGTALIFQTVATKRARGPSGLPPTRADLYRP
ncbi:SAM-dependent methyltransferase [Elioraea rosea]|uniref:SAM-dependent methyltransferase n=1 Tax=Elioraea rosea TaxID=2492390 RepID=UPI001951DB6B|nr:cyclopropane-fatty-acyl-phospholipid synthase family protein [Elioraea rosea]